MALPILPATALVDIATAEFEVGITPLASAPIDAAVARIISAASDAIKEYCNRHLEWNFRSETSAQRNGPARIVVKDTPIYPSISASVLQVQLLLDPGVFEGVTTILVNGQDFYVEDCDRGFLFRQMRWPSTTLRRPDIVQDEDLDAAELTTQVNYLAGYLTVPQILQAVPWPGGATTPAAGLVMTPASQLGQVWGCTTPGVTGGVQPTWPGTPAQFATVTDGAAVWTFLGWNSTVTTLPQARTLPYSIEQAAIETFTTWWRRRGKTVETTMEKFGDASVSFGPDERDSLPPSVCKLLNPYVSVVM